jgi:hypothetical protein
LIIAPCREIASLDEFPIKIMELVARKPVSLVCEEGVFCPKTQSPCWLIFAPCGEIASLIIVFASVMELTSFARAMLVANLNILVCEEGNGCWIVILFDCPTRQSPCRLIGSSCGGIASLMHVIVERVVIVARKRKWGGFGLK